MTISYVESYRFEGLAESEAKDKASNTHLFGTIVLISGCVLLFMAVILFFFSSILFMRTTTTPPEDNWINLVEAQPQSRREEVILSANIADVNDSDGIDGGVDNLFEDDSDKKTCDK